MNKKKIIIIVSIVALVLIGALVGVLLYVNRDKGDSNDKNVTKAEECPIDFKSLKEKNQDVYAYVEVPDTKISYPVLQRENDESYYSNHTIDNVEGRVPGAIYTEPINNKDFSDCNTILYGHNMKDGTMFASLHQFEEPGFFNQDRVIYIYTPEHKYTYKVFAATTIDDEHLMYKYGFTTGAENIKFVTDLQNAGGQYKQGTEIKMDTKLCTLFTCTADDAQRFVVVGYLADVQNYKQ